MSEDTVLTCPECDSPEVKAQVPHSMHSHGSGAEYRCGTCYATFDEPVERERYGGAFNGPGNNGLAKELVDADPDDVVPDGGTDLLAEYDEVVVLTGQGGNGSGPRRFHLEADCKAIRESGKGTRTVLADRVPDYWRICKLCSGEAEPWSGRDDGHYKALVAAAEAEDDAVPDGGVPLAGEPPKDPEPDPRSWTCAGCKTPYHGRPAHIRQREDGGFDVYCSDECRDADGPGLVPDGGER